jgi:hypothetical protein
LLIFVAVLALTMQVLAPYLVWPNRWNIPTHLVTGFCITAYVIPGFFTNLWDGFNEETVTTFAGINFLGALALCLGIVLPQFLVNHNYPNPFAKFSGVDKNSVIMTRRIVPIFLIAVVGIYIAYAGMGFMPMFADDPFSARQFRGVYSEPYYRVAIIFRFSFFIISSIMPIVLLVAWEKKSKYLYALAFFGVMALFVSLSRSSMATGVLFFVGILAASQRSRWPIRWYIITVIGLFPLGSVFFYWIGHFLGVSAMMDVYDGSVFDNIATGSPDISDQLSWLNGFLRGSYFSYGRTIIGGLVPGNYEWNPSVWTLTYDDIGADISEMVTGGLRLTPAEWGFANFGWFGVVVIPLISGILNGFMLIYLKRAEGVLNRMQFASALLVYFTLGQQIVQFYTLNMYSVPGIAAALFFWQANKKALRNRVIQYARDARERSTIAQSTQST